MGEGLRQERTLQLQENGRKTGDWIKSGLNQSGATIGEVSRDWVLKGRAEDLKEISVCAKLYGRILKNFGQ